MVDSGVQSVTHIPSYPKVYNLGHPALEHLLDGPVVVQEKVNGSQFSFMATVGGGLSMRSKGADIYEETTDKLFRPGVDTVLSIRDELRPGWVYRGEMLAKPKHNSLAYARVPAGNVVLFDVESAADTFLNARDLADEADRLGLECVPLMYSGGGEAVTLDLTTELLQREAMLGGGLVEGVVIKNHHRWGKDGKFLAGKHVSEVFKETHKREWKGSNPKGQDVIDTLIHEMAQPTRWAKAVQHMRDRGELTDSPKDIGALLNEAKADITAEERDYIAGKLLEWALPKVLRGAVGGLPQWYKDQLLERQFEDQPHAS